MMIAMVFGLLPSNVVSRSPEPNYVITISNEFYEKLDDLTLNLLITFIQKKLDNYIKKTILNGTYINFV